ncbi:hypothetical protein [Rickettsia helvetica]|uniref:Bacitracin ABC transporter ATP-binding protein n=1 Tax=Rickettsia helvetica TaxID=35789 RepID=A0ABP0T2H5_RICHE|nr:hypothetical protein [Rickettsia helvetica]MCZ6884349.1 hypothetical protein [Rickettsia endosymbiont of Ixodes ricinus]MCZ6896816.1 hypothetical protein [Rickettsia endosymbiont of Ixodes ricinus]
MSLHEIIIKISKIFSIFIPKQDTGKSNDNIPANREAMHDYYEDLNHPH